MFLGKPRCNHMQAGIARPAAKGKSDAGFGLDSLVSLCPGPGNSWGNLAASPASKEAVSPSINILYCTVQGGGGTKCLFCWENPKFCPQLPIKSVWQPVRCLDSAKPNTAVCLYQLCLVWYYLQINTSNKPCRQMY